MVVMPNDINTENSVLGTVMRNNELLHQFPIKENDFYGIEQKAIFRCICGVVEEGNITDINSLNDYATRHKERVVNDILLLQIFKQHNTLTFTQDVQRLRRMSKQRRCWEMLQKAAMSVVDPSIDFGDEVGELINSLSEVQNEDDSQISSFADALTELKEIVDNNLKGKKVCLSTGFSIFDDYYLIRPNTMTVIAAFTSVGKSSLAMNISVNVARQGNGVAYYSLEMGKAELASRVVSKDAELPASVVMNKKLLEWQLSDFERAMKKNENLPIYIDECSTISFDKTISSIRTMVKQKDIKLAVIDYLQIYSQSIDNTESNLASMARAAKNIAKEMGIAVLLLSQLNRNGNHPNIKMLRGSGQIEESADNIVLIDRPDAYPDNAVTKYEGEFSNEPIKGTAKLMLVKGRGVGTGCCLVGFDGKYTQFYELNSKPLDIQQDNTPF